MLSLFLEVKILQVTSVSYTVLIDSSRTKMVIKQGSGITIFDIGKHRKVIKKAM